MSGMSFVSLQSDGFQSIIPTLLLVAAVLLFVVYLYGPEKQQPGQGTPLHMLPGPKSHSHATGFMTAEEAKRNDVGPAAERAGAVYGDNFFAHSFNSAPLLYTADPTVVRCVMITHAHHFNHSPRVQRLIETFIGKGMVGLHGQVHRRHRKVATPAFTATSIRNNTDAVYGIAAKLVSFTRSVLQSDTTATDDGFKTVNLHDVFERASCDVIGQVGFNYAFNSLGGGPPTDLRAAFHEQGQQMLIGSTYRLWRLNISFVSTLGNLLGVKEEKQLRSIQKRIYTVAERLLSEAKEKVRFQADRQHGGHAKGSAPSQVLGEQIEGKDLLSQLVRCNMSSDAKASEKLTDDSMKAMVPDFFFAGTDTTTNALSWCIQILTRDDDGLSLQRRLRQELSDHDADGWQTNWSKLDSLPLLDAVMRETLRMRAPVHILSREVVKKDGITIPLSKPVKGADGQWIDRLYLRKGDGVSVRLNEMNMAEEYWGPDAKQFRPERWQTGHQRGHGLDDPLDGEKSGGHVDVDSKAAGAPKGLGLGWSGMATFGMGPKACIGFRLATTQFKILLATTLANFEFLKTDDEIGGE